MTPHDRCAGLAAAARVHRDELMRLGDALAERPDAEVVAAPSAGAVLLELGTAVGSFCAGEVVVTTAVARLGDREGWGCTLGWDDAAALAAALCAAAATPAVDELAAESLQREAEERAARQLAVSATRIGS